MGLQREIPRKPLFIVLVCMITITVVVDVSLWVSQPSSSVNDESDNKANKANKTIPVSEDSDTNQTLCVYLKQFSLSENKKSVCVCHRRCRSC